MGKNERNRRDKRKKSSESENNGGVQKAGRLTSLNKSTDSVNVSQF
jgi:hypothetical protein